MADLNLLDDERELWKRVPHEIDILFTRLSALRGEKEAADTQLNELCVQTNMEDGRPLNLGERVKLLGITLSSVRAFAEAADKDSARLEYYAAHHSDFGFDRNKQL